MLQCFNGYRPNTKTPIYSPEKVQALKTALMNAQLTIVRRTPGNQDEITRFQREIRGRVAYLEQEYKGNFRSYAMFQVLKSDRKPPEIKHEDFPGEDSVEKFLTDLIARYDK